MAATRLIVLHKNRWKTVAQCLKDRIDDFVKMCMAYGWLVNRLDVENQIDIYARAEEEIEFM